MNDFSDYIVYVDESGDHGLTSIDPQFPVFALSLCVFEKRDYVNMIVPEVQRLKFQFWGHDAVILHEHEIRKSKGDFRFLLTDADLRHRFYDDLNRIMTDGPMNIIAAVIDKSHLTKQMPRADNPYNIALLVCLEKLISFLASKGQSNKTTHVIFECRGAVEDSALELAFRRYLSGEIEYNYIKRAAPDITLKPVFAKKLVNSAGLQLADLTARPIALKVLRPGQPNRTREIIDEKLYSLDKFPRLTTAEQNEAYQRTKKQKGLGIPKT